MTPVSKTKQKGTDLMAETVDKNAEMTNDDTESLSSEPSNSAKAASDGALFTHATGRVIACLFALASFGVAMISGLASDNPASSVLTRALMAMFLSYPVGWIVGMICQHVIDDHLKIHKEANPALDSTVEFPMNLQQPKKEKDEEILTV